MTTAEHGAIDMWRARQGVIVSGIAVAQAHRQQADADRALVEKLTRDVDVLIEDLSRHAVMVGRLRMERDQWKAQLEATAEHANRTMAELIAERDQAIYDRDSARAALDGR